MKKVIVSVVLPVYNGELYVDNAVQSVLRQTHSNLELIIINDGSTDSTWSIVNGYDDERVVLVNISNRGVSEARNVGIVRAKGSYIAFIDADDLWRIDKLEIQLKYILKGYDLVYTDGEIVDINGNVIERSMDTKFGLYSGHSGSLELCKGGFYIPTSSVLVRKEVLHEVGGFDDNLSRAEDFDLWLRILLNNYFVSGIEIQLIDYRIHENQSSDIDKAHTAEIIDILVNYWDRFKPYQSRLLLIIVLRLCHIKKNTNWMSNYALSRDFTLLTPWWFKMFIRLIDFKCLVLIPRYLSSIILKFSLK